MESLSISHCSPAGLLLHAAVLSSIVVPDDVGLLASDERRLEDASRHESSDCCGRNRTSLWGATVASSVVQHSVADAELASTASASYSAGLAK
jgi:hypothetical protein